MATDYKYDVFISYSRKDYVDDTTKEIVPGNVISIIKKIFDDNGITYWIDEEGNLTGKKFAHIIAGRIRESIVFLFVCSKNSVASKWVDRELSVADTFDKHIIPFICDDSFKDDKVVMFTASLDRVEFFGKFNPEKEIAKLIKTIKKDKEEYEEKRKKEEEQLKQKQKEEEERRKREEQARKKREAIMEIKHLAADCRMYSLQQETLVQQLYEKNLFIGNDTKECPVCKKTSSIESIFCEKCGFQFPQLYAIDGNESYSFDKRQLALARTNHDAFALIEKEKVKLEEKIGELTASYEKLSDERNQYAKTIAQKEAEVVSYREKCNKLSSQLKERDRLSEKNKQLEQQKKEIEKQKKEVEARLEKLEDEKNDAVRKIKELKKEQGQYQDDSRRNQQSNNDFNQRSMSGFMSGSRWNWQSNNDFNQHFEQHTIIEGAIDGVFSVSPTKRVFFSKGNLQYQIKTGIWRFAENQFDIAEKISSYNDHWIDLFGWGTGGNPTNYYRDSSLYSSFVDWGGNSIKNGGGLPNTWFTLSDNEWTFVFDKRSTRSGIRYVKACVNKVNGVILLPDNWNSNIYGLNSINNADANYIANTINPLQWNRLEHSGAVFLPAAGYRIDDSKYLVGIFGHYWSASHSLNSYYSYSYNLYFNSGLLIPSYSEYRHYGFSVRLVRLTV